MPLAPAQAQAPAGTATTRYCLRVDPITGSRIETIQCRTRDDWAALDLTANPRGGLGSWGKGDIVEYLRSGRNARASASGSMQEVIYHSTSRMSDSDLAAIATYLKELPPSAPARNMRPPDAAVMRSGAAIYVDNCSACHGPDGEGRPRYFPPLAGDAPVQAKDPTTIIRIILEGSRSVPTPAKPTAPAMPPFAWKLSDSEIASVTTFVRNSWGNSAPSVSRSQVGKLRARHASD